MAKLDVPPEAVSEFLDNHFGKRCLLLGHLHEGIESHAFRFEVDKEIFVLRINPSARGFEKDRWAHVVVGRRVPVPRVVDFGMLDAAHAYCITEWVPGVTLEDLPLWEAEIVVDDVREVWSEIATCGVEAVDGFGDFDADGSAPARS